MIALPYGFGLTPAGALIGIILAGLAALAYRRFLRPGRLWALCGAAVLGAALFLLAVFAVQVHLQLWLSRLILDTVSPFWLGRHTGLLPAAIALLAGLCQESARLLALFLALRLLAPDVDARGLGAAVGAGVGGIEAVIVLGAVPPAHFSVFSAAVLERVGAVAFHTGAGAALGIGLGARRVGLAFVLVTVVHWGIDTMAGLVQLGALSGAFVLGATLVVGLGTLFLAWLCGNGWHFSHRSGASLT